MSTEPERFPVTERTTIGRSPDRGTDDRSVAEAISPVRTPTGIIAVATLLTLGMYLAVGMSICAGYHRFFSHKSYEAHPAVQTFYAIFGAMAAQNSILWWSSSHRVHHSYVDKDWDPYNIKRGFWWAHILWIFYKNPQRDDSFDNAKDLLQNKVVMWQHRWHKVILIVGGFGLPTLIGAAFGLLAYQSLWGDHVDGLGARLASHAGCGQTGGARHQGRSGTRIGKSIRICASILPCGS